MTQTQVEYVARNIGRKSQTRTQLSAEIGAHAAGYPHQTRIHLSLSLITIESLFDLVKFGFWSGEATPGVSRPVIIRGALKNIFNSKYLSEELEGEVYKAIVLPTLLYGCEAWSLWEDLFKRLRSFHSRCARSIVS